MYGGGGGKRLCILFDLKGGKRRKILVGGRGGGRPLPLGIGGKFLQRLCCKEESGRLQLALERTEECRGERKGMGHISSTKR